MRVGLIGETLGHSRSPELHALLADYDYHLWPLAPEELGAFMRARDFDGLNVTIPYKQAVIPHLDGLSPEARRAGSVNTVVKRADGTLFGDNTDLCGMAEMTRRAGMRLGTGKTLVLGSGGTSRTACALAREAGGEPVVISRRGENTYENLERHADARWLINATPVGLYPHTHEAPVDLRRLPGLRGVADAIYNPLRTRLLQQARELRIPCEGGLCMLVWQAARAVERFTGEAPEAARVEHALSTLRRRGLNVALVGMPGTGKSTVGALVGKALGLETVDIDAEIAREAGMSIPAIFAAEGEAGFRAREAALIRRYGRESGRVLVTGGGAVLSPENRESLRLNGYVAHITRPIERLAMDGRPLSQSREALAALWRTRAPLYAACADGVFPNDKQPGDCARAIVEGFHEALCD